MGDCVTEKMEEDSLRKEGAQKMLDLILKHGLDSGFAVSANIDQLWKDWERPEVRPPLHLDDQITY